MESYAPLLDVYRWLGHCINAPNHIHMQICAHNKPTMLHSNFFYLCFVTMLHCLVHDFSRFFYELFKKCIFIINCVCVCVVIAAISTQNIHLHLKLLLYTHMHSAHQIKRANHFFPVDIPNDDEWKNHRIVHELAAILFIH